jgi:glutaredoxin-like protein NrdH
MPNTRTINDPPVTVYTQPGCYQCKATGRYLKDNNIPFRFVDVTEDEGAYNHIKDLGYSSVPVVASGFDHWSGYDPFKLAEIPR